MLVSIGMKNTGVSTNGMQFVAVVNSFLRGAITFVRKAISLLFANSRTLTPRKLA